MNISYNWLRDYLDIDLNAAELSTILTNIGLEVEAVEHYEKIKGGLEGFVIGEVRTCERHPDADKLSITTVDIGSGTMLNIVCGAPNVATGQKVVVATVGSTVYKGDESLEIRKTRLRGVVSEGMICAEDEIGMGSNHDGILILSPDAKTGTPAKEYFNLEHDTIFAIGLTPNRIDSVSHYGVARDLAAFLGNEKNIRVRLPDTGAFKTDNTSYKVDVSIENPDSCNRYAGVSMTGVTIGSSPQWLQERLLAIGLNPICNVVDVTNFVMHELGQPLHAFDADQLSGHRIIVKNMPAGTPFITLDGIEHKLAAEDLMICDAAGPVAIAGVFGGLHSGVTPDTRNIFLESAYFNPVSVRNTARRLSISTDASFRFERGIDPNITITALKRTALLIKETAGGSVSSAIVDVYPRPIHPVKVVVTYKNIDRLIGISIDRARIKSILKSLEINILEESPDRLLLEVPPYRVDVTREADIIEEILRIYGYNNVPVSETLKTSLSYTAKPDREKLVNRISDLLCGSGFTEIMSNSITSSAYYEKLKTYPSENLVRIMNPLSNELNVMRQTLIFGGLEAIIHNVNRKNPNLRLFEYGNCYFYNPENSKKEPLAPYHEEFHFGIFLTGLKNEPNWTVKEENTTFFQLKGYVENALLHLGFDIQSLQAELYTGKPDLYEQAIQLKHDNIPVAEIAVLSKDLVASFDIKSDVFYADLIWETIVNITAGFRLQFAELPRFPEVRRDLALLLNKTVTFEEVKELAYKTERQLLKKVSLFDVYEDEKIGKDKKSYAVSFILQDKEKTLTDERIEKAMKNLMAAYIKDLHAEIR
ncbi:MAG: phenylalanine--tRNA ligase subunit beta [Bacteroidales bacterium]|nr:phenylalanine--tRNA ligase subunit beta [Bacteroidales bacterium]